MHEANQQKDNPRYVYRGLTLAGSASAPRVATSADLERSVAAGRPTVSAAGRASVASARDDRPTGATRGSNSSHTVERASDAIGGRGVGNSAGALSGNKRGPSSRPNTSDLHDDRRRATSANITNPSRGGAIPAAAGSGAPIDLVSDSDDEAPIEGPPIELSSDSEGSPIDLSDSDDSSSNTAPLTFPSDAIEEGGAAGTRAAIASAPLRVVRPLQTPATTVHPIIERPASVASHPSFKATPPPLHRRELQSTAHSTGKSKSSAPSGRASGSPFDDATSPSHEFEAPHPSSDPAAALVAARKRLREIKMLAANNVVFSKPKPKDSEASTLPLIKLPSGLAIEYGSVSYKTLHVLYVEAVDNDVLFLNRLPLIMQAHLPNGKHLRVDKLANSGIVRESARDGRRIDTCTFFL